MSIVKTKGIFFVLTVWRKKLSNTQFLFNIKYSFLFYGSCHLLLLPSPSPKFSYCQVMKRIGVSDAQKRICFCTFGFLKLLRWYWGTGSPVKMPWTCRNDSKNTFKYWSCFVGATHLPALREHFPQRARSTAAHWVRNSQCRPLSGVLRGHLRTLSPFCRRFCNVGTRLLCDDKDEPI